MREYKKGTLCKLDFLHNKVEAKALEVIEEGQGNYVTQGKIKVVVTESCGPYKKGEVLTVTAHQAVPKKQWKKTQYSFLISTLYKWIK